MDTAVKAPPGEGDVEITEFEVFEVESVKGVKAGANGFPHLLLKGLDDGAEPTSAAPAEPAEVGRPSWHAAAAALARLGAKAPDIDPAELFKAVNAAGEVDEAPDIAGGKQAIALIGKLIEYEAQELQAGCLDEVCDISLLCQAAECLKCWLGMEQAPDGAMKGCGCCGQCTAPGDGCCEVCGFDALKAAEDAQDEDRAAKGLLSGKERNDLPDSAFAYIEPGGKKDADGKTTPRKLRHFPVHDKAHADNAMARIEGGAEFGDEARPKVKAAQRKFARNDATKATAEAVVAEEATAVDTEAQEITDGLQKAIDEAIAKALGSSQERFTALEDELAKARADLTEMASRPVHGGPVLSAAAVRAASKPGEDYAAKAAYYDEQAGKAADPTDAVHYRQLAAQQRAQIPAS